MSKREIPKKNYYILIIMLIGVAVLTLAISSIVNAVKNNNVSTGYINRYVSEISYSELDTYLVEPASNTFIYITYTGDEQIYKLEKNLKKIVNNYELATDFVYVNVTENMIEDNFVNKLKEKLKISEKISKLPVILYYKDGILTDLVDSEENLFNVADFQKLLDNYEIAS